MPKAVRQLDRDLLSFRRSGSLLGFLLRGFVLVLLPAQQFPIDIGDLLQTLLDLMVVVDPAADLFNLPGRHCAARSMSLVQSHAQIPYWPVSLTTGAPALRLAAGQIALH